MDPKTATKLDEVDLLRYQNWKLRGQILQAEGDGIILALAAKYKSEGEQIGINVDTGDITRTQGPPAP